MRRIRFFLCVVAALGAMPACSQTDYPTRPLRLIIPNAPGSSVDTIGRALAAHLSTSLNGSVFAENRAGAAGMLGMEAGRTAVADGYTFIVAPRGMPTLALGKFRDALVAALHVPALAATLTANGAIPHLTTPAQFRALLIRDIDATRRTMRSAGIEPE